MAQTLQFLRVHQTTGHYSYVGATLGMDFTVGAAINVTSIGILDADAVGFSGSVSARIFDRATNRIVGGPVVVEPGVDGRTDDANPFAFKAVAVQLDPGAYCIVAGPLTNDRYVSTGYGRDSVARGDSGGNAVLITGAFSASSDLLSVNVISYWPDHIHAGATFLFTLVAVPPWSPLAEGAPVMASSTMVVALTTTTALVSSDVTALEAWGNTINASSLSVAVPPVAPDGETWITPLIVAISVLCAISVVAAIAALFVHSKRVRPATPTATATTTVGDDQFQSAREQHSLSDHDRLPPPRYAVHVREFSMPTQHDGHYDVLTTIEVQHQQQAATAAYDTRLIGQY